MKDKKLSEVIAETEQQKKKENGDEPIKLLEFTMVVRAGSINKILEGIQKATKSFVYGDEKIGSWSGATSNYDFILSEK